MGIGVIDVHGQTTEALSQRNRQSVVVGIPNRAPRGQRTVLRLHESGGERGGTEKSGCHLIDQSLRIRPVVARKERARVRGCPALHGIE